MRTVFPVFGTNDEIRVAFLPDMYGFYKIEENGDFSGYNYDYLMNVAQHTGWTYEFVIIQEGLTSTSLKKAEEMLESGEIDLLGPFSVTSTKFNDFESGSQNYGVYRYNLYSARNKYAITSDNYFLKETLRVALVENYTDLNETFFQIIGEVGVNIEVTYVNTHSETHELLFNEDVDTLLNLDMSSNAENLDYLTTIQRIPFYFVSTKGNTELIAELDEAIKKVEIIEPEIHQILLEKYFGTRFDTDFMFTDEEISLLSEMTSFKVGMLVNEPPYQYKNKEEENVGISIDILGKLEEIIGVSFEIVWKDTHDELVTAILTQEIDLIATVPNDYTLASSLSVVLTNPYISSSAYWLTSVNQVENPDVFFHFVSSPIPFYKQSEMGTTMNIESDLKILNDTGTLTIFCDPYITAYYLGVNQYDNIEVKSVTDVLSEMTFGVGTHIDVHLIGMINRAILYLDSNGIDEIIYNHTSVKPEYTLLDALNEHSSKIVSVLLFLSVIAIISIRNTANRFKELSRRDGMTKLYNSGYFHDYATKKTPKLSSGALILIDIDYFKDVNDTHGHQAGDEIIKQVAHNLRKFSTADSINSRLGGDEFAIFMEGSVLKEDIDETIISILNAMINNETGIPTTLSIGAYIFNAPLDYKTLYTSTDKVLYKVKENGRNGFLVEKDTENNCNS